METITVAASRIDTPHTPGMVVLVGIALVILAIAWVVLKRHRHPPGA